MLLPHLNMLWRLFFLQTSRNDKTVDGLGFLHVLTPLFRDLADDEEELQEMANRYAGYFNANPILASYIIGVVMNLERRKKAGEEIPHERIERIKSTLSSVLTAKGDYFFEIVLIPFALTIGSIFAIYDSYMGPVVFLGFYNLYHLQSRIGGYRIGLLMGEDVGRELARSLFREQRFLGGCAAFVSGVFAALVLARAWDFGGPKLAAQGVLTAAAFVILARKLPLVWVVAILFLATVVVLGVS
jgi:mannose/fructose/N-acetylgalactosamine-specific phosphotransferase system component IID